MLVCSSLPRELGSLRWEMKVFEWRRSSRTGNFRQLWCAVLTRLYVGNVWWKWESHLNGLESLEPPGIIDICFLDCQNPCVAGNSAFGSVQTGPIWISHIDFDWKRLQSERFWRNKFDVDLLEKSSTISISFVLDNSADPAMPSDPILSSDYDPIPNGHCPDRLDRKL